MSGSTAQNEWVQRVLGLNLAGGGDAAGDGGAGDGPLVAYRKALLDFGKARSSVNSQLSSLSKALTAKLPDEAKLADAIATDVTAFCEQLQDSIDAGLNAVGEGRQERIKQLQEEIEDLIGAVSANKLIAHVDGNPIQPTSVSKTLVKALTRLADTVN